MPYTYRFTTKVLSDAIARSLGGKDLSRKPKMSSLKLECRSIFLEERHLG